MVECPYHPDHGAEPFGPYRGAFSVDGLSFSPTYGSVPVDSEQVEDVSDIEQVEVGPAGGFVFEPCRET